MINIAILGCGVVGGGCASLIVENKKMLEALAKDTVEIKYILDLRDMPDSPFADKMVKDFNIILEDSEVDVVIETMGGARPAYDFTLACLESGKHVVTSNKEVVSKFGDTLLEAARRGGVNYLFEASVGGGIPLLRTITDGIASANEITEISGILNGTTNYILTRMFGSGASFEAALAEAQEKGYAERNPSADVDGIDAARKTNILAALATGKLAGEELIHTEGITKINGDDVKSAKKYGAEIKLLGRVVKTEGGTYAYVAPHFVPHSNMLSNVSGVYNAVSVSGNYIGDALIYGQGAGAKATASAVISDVANIISGKETRAARSFERDNSFPSDFSGFCCKRYVRFSDGESLDKAVLVFENAKILEKNAIITPEMSEKEFSEKISVFKVENVIRVL